MPPKNKLFKGPLATIVVLALFLGIATFLLQNSTQLEDTNLEESTSEEIVVRSDGNDFDGLAVFPTWSTVEPATFPIVIDGQARGTWYFEANFPIEVQLRDGVVLATGFAQAQEDWMTEEIVTFYAELQRVEGAPEHVGMAALILRKANPSGVPENDAEFVTQILIDTTR